MMAQEIRTVCNRVHCEKSTEEHRTRSLRHRFVLNMTSHDTTDNKCTTVRSPRARKDGATSYLPNLPRRRTARAQHWQLLQSAPPIIRPSYAVEGQFSHEGVSHWL